MEELDSEPDAPEEKPVQEIDLLSFYKELSALRHESMKTARRTNESFSSFQQVLLELESSTKKKNHRIDSESQIRESVQLEKKVAMLQPFVELFIRLDRLHENSDNSPTAPSGLFLLPGKRAGPN